MVELQVGDQFPTNVTSVTENNPGQHVDLGKELGKGKVVVFGVPGAVSSHRPLQFSPSDRQLCVVHSAAQRYVVVV